MQKETLKDKPVDRASLSLKRIWSFRLVWNIPNSVFLMQKRAYDVLYSEENRIIEFRLMTDPVSLTVNDYNIHVCIIEKIKRRNFHICRAKRSVSNGKSMKISRLK